MIDLSKYAALFADTARGGIADENVVFITAYPRMAKPTLLKSAVAAFSVYDKTALHFLKKYAVLFAVNSAYSALKLQKQSLMQTQNVRLHEPFLHLMMKY